MAYRNHVLRLKEGVSIRGLSNECLFALVSIHSIFNYLGYETVVTSGTEGAHSRGSEHYKGDALDFRTRHMSSVHKDVLLEMTRSSIGPDYDVILEPTHLHIEYDPKTPLNT